MLAEYLHLQCKIFCLILFTRQGLHALEAACNGRQIVCRYHHLVKRLFICYPISDNGYCLIAKLHSLQYHALTNTCTCTFIWNFEQIMFPRVELHFVITRCHLCGVAASVVFHSSCGMRNKPER